MGGSYYRVKEGEPTGWNPAALPPTKRNIAFIEGPGEAALYSQQ
ncbi:conjugal transfer protein (plasmid) [Salmonella enterica]|nr:conjugal transfer protein [Salmonella enterica]